MRFSASIVALAAADIGKSTYAMVDPFKWKDWAEKYLPTAEHLVQANSTEMCVEWVKLCVDDGSEAFSQCSQRGPLAAGTQLHSVGAYKRETGKYSMATLEQMFTESLGDFSAVTPFMSNHAAFYTTDLASYQSALKAGGETTLALAWTDPETKKAYSSVLVQAAGSIMVLELIGDASLDGAVPYGAPRATTRALQLAEAHVQGAERRYSADDKGILKFMHLSIASSDVAKDGSFFTETMLGTKVGEYTSAEGSVFVGTWSNFSAELRFEQSAAKDVGPWTVEAWNAYQLDLHKQCIQDDGSTTNGFDRLADNHFGVSFGHGGDVTQYVTAGQSSGAPYKFYGAGHSDDDDASQNGGVLFYEYMPNGWGVQISGPCQDCPSGPSYDFCTQGITGSCTTELQPAFLQKVYV